MQTIKSLYSFLDTKTMGKRDGIRISHIQGPNGLLIASSSKNSKFHGKKVQQKFDIRHNQTSGLSGIKNDISTLRNYHSANKSGYTEVLNSSAH